MSTWNHIARCDLPYSTAKLCDALDFFRPEVIDWIRAVGEEPRLHNKQWEYAQVLEARKRYAPNAKRLVGLGCGIDAIIPKLAETAELVTATDLYGRPGAWKAAQQRPDEFYPQVKNLRVHPMNMRQIDLPRGAFDFVWSLCAVEHVGSADDVIDTVRQAGELLAPGGVMAITTEFTFAKRPFYAPARPSGTMYFDATMLRRLYTETGLHFVEPMDLRVSTHPMNVPVWDQINNRGLVNVPHILYRAQPLPFHGCWAATASVVLSREDHGTDRLIEDPEQDERLAPLFALGRSLNFRLAPLTRWF